MRSLNLVTNSPEETQALGRAIGELAGAGDVVLMVGELGAGKTCLTQGIAWGLDIDEYTLSPTFIIVRELYGRLPLYHIDLYRLDDIAEIDDLGLDEYLYADGLCVVEWAEKGLDILPPEHLLIEISHFNDTRRDFRIMAGNRHYEEMIEQLSKHELSRGGAG